LDQKDQSIVAQVAAKIALEAWQKEGEASGSFENVYPAYVEVAVNAILNAVAIAEERNPAPKPETRPITPQQVAQRFSGAKIESESADTWSVQVKGTQHGDLPDWLFAAAAEKGTRKVWDNRDKAHEPTPSGKPRPWFVDVDNRDKAYWPPRG
jgi:hypothetical protein